MAHKFGLFINLDYAHKADDACSLIWQKIRDRAARHGFSFEKRVFVIFSEKSAEQLSADVRVLLDEILIEQDDLYSYIVDCYILNLDNCTDLTLPDTSGSIDVEDISLDDLDVLGIKYNLPLKNRK